jgi:hypothetical protein
MKKILIIGCAALALAGCNKGGTSDQYDSGSGVGSSSSLTNTPSTTPSQSIPAPSDGGTIRQNGASPDSTLTTNSLNKP